MIVLRKSWVGLIFAVRGSVFRNIAGRLAVTVLISGVVTVAYFLLGQPRWTLTALPFTLVGLALSIFLGFRNNTSYDRFWEGRKLWGQLVNCTRSFGRRVRLYVGARAGGGDEAELVALRRELVYGVAAYVHALRLHLRDHDDWASLDHLIDGRQLQSARQRHNVPLALLGQIAERLQQAYRRGWVDAYHLVALEQSLSEMMDIQGGCERIKSTPIPYSFTVLIHRIVAFYCVGLPFGIVGKVGYLTPLVVAMIAYAFYGLDAIGDELEEPFGCDVNDLPLAALSRMIEVNLRQELGETEVPALIAADARGVLS